MNRSLTRRGALKGLISASVAATALPKSARAVWPYTPPGAFNSDLNINTEWFNVVSFGAVGDGASHPASSIYGSLAALQAAYPWATALTNEINWLAFQGAIYAAENAGGAVVFVPYGTYVMDNSSSALDGSGTLFQGEYENSAFASSYPANILGCGGRAAFGQNNASSVLYWPSDLGKPSQASFTGAISGTTLTASSVSNFIIPNMWLSGSGVATATKILYQITGTANGAGTYRVSISQSVSSEAMTASFVVIGNWSGRRAGMVMGQSTDTFNGEHAYIQDIDLFGPGVGNTKGVSTSDMIGLQTCDRVVLERITCNGFYAGLNVVGGQTAWRDSIFEGNFYGAYFQSQSSQFGDMVIERCSFSTNNMAGIGCGAYFGILQASVFTMCIFDTQPYGIYKEPFDNATAAAGITPTNAGGAGLFIYDCSFIGCQFENCGNGAVGQSLFNDTVTGSISGTTLTTTGSPNIRIGQYLTTADGGQTIAADTFVTAIGGANTFTVSVSQTASPSGPIIAGRPSTIHNTRFQKCQMGWWNSAGGSSSLVLAGYPATGLIQSGDAIGLSIVEPIITFQMAPGSDSIFDISTMANGSGGTQTPQIGVVIKGDVSAMILNCITGSLGGHGFFSSNSFISPGYARIEDYGGWIGEATYVAGFGAVALGSVIKAVFPPSSPTLCAGNPQDDVQGILVFGAATWGIVAREGIVPVASGANSISAGQWVRTDTGGTIIAATGKNDTTSVVIGYATGNSSGGMTAVKLQGLS